ncbi:MAG: hypothetical protein AAF378_10665 [Cyanobacteria bacterium P01_A01_bin.84]
MPIEIVDTFTDNINGQVANSGFFPANCSLCLCFRTTQSDPSTEVGVLEQLATNFSVTFQFETANSEAISNFEGRQITIGEKTYTLRDATNTFNFNNTDGTAFVPDNNEIAIFDGDVNATASSILAKIQENPFFNDVDFTFNLNTIVTGVIIQIEANEIGNCYAFDYDISSISPYFNVLQGNEPLEDVGHRIRPDYQAFVQLFEGLLPTSDSLSEIPLIPQTLKGTQTPYHHTGASNDYPYYTVLCADISACAAELVSSPLPILENPNTLDSTSNRVLNYRVVERASGFEEEYTPPIALTNVFRIMNAKCNADLQNPLDLSRFFPNAAIGAEVEFVRVGKSSQALTFCEDDPILLYLPTSSSFGNTFINVRFNDASGTPITISSGVAEIDGFNSVNLNRAFFNNLPTNRDIEVFGTTEVGFLTTIYTEILTVRIEPSSSPNCCCGKTVYWLNCLGTFDSMRLNCEYAQGIEVNLKEAIGCEDCIQTSSANNFFGGSSRRSISHFTPNIENTRENRLWVRDLLSSKEVYLLENNSILDINLQPIRLASVPNVYADSRRFFQLNLTFQRNNRTRLSSNI